MANNKYASLAEALHNETSGRTFKLLQAAVQDMRRSSGSTRLFAAALSEAPCLNMDWAEAEAADLERLNRE